MEIKIRVTRDERCLLHVISTIQFPAKKLLINNRNTTKRYETLTLKTQERHY